MAIGSSAVCGTYKREINAGIHFWTSHSRGDGSSIAADTFKIALFTNSSSIDADTTGYAATNEVSGTNYTAGWSSATITDARGALIYNSTLANAGTAGDTTHAAKPSVCVINFGGDSSSSAGNFTVTMPANDANNALIRIA